VVVKSGATFERLGAIGRVAIDKTGTLTRNEPTVTAAIASRPMRERGVTADDVLDWAAALERHSTHPLAAAITAGALQRQAGTPGADGTAHRVDVAEREATVEPPV